MGGLANFCELISITSGSIAKLAFKNEKKFTKYFINIIGKVMIL